MPLPKPNKGEDAEKFHARCMGNSTMVSEYPDVKQRNAVCYSQWRRKKKEKATAFNPESI